MIGIILAAGRGSRLGDLTEEVPKCFMELRGRKLIEWQYEALSACCDITLVVTGYRENLIREMGYPTIHNSAWSSTNMVGSLACVIDRCDGPLLISYSDIVYPPDIAKQAAEAEGDVVVCYDPNWESLWRRRFSDPLDDAETFKLDNGRIVEIGSRPESVQDVEGQFMGLMKFGTGGIDLVKQLLSEDPSFRTKLDSTTMLMKLINGGHRVSALPVSGGWCEVDDQSDLRVAEAMVEEGILL